MSEPIDKLAIEIKSSAKGKLIEVRKLLLKKDGLTDEEWLKLAGQIRDEYTIRWAIGAVTGGYENIGAYSSFVKAALDVMESHFRITETKVRVSAIAEPKKEFVNQSRRTREEARARVLKLVKNE